MTPMYAPDRATTPEHTVRIDNMEMYYEEYGVGKPLVLLHGFGGCTQNWHPFTAELSERHRLIVVDLRGHGHSTNPENRFTHREAASELPLAREVRGWSLLGYGYQLIAQFNALHDNDDDMNFTEQTLSTITARTLVVHGDRDRFFPVEIPVNLYRSIPDAALWIIPGGDHVPISDPTVPFVSTALRFLDGPSSK